MSKTLAGAARTTRPTLFATGEAWQRHGGPHARHNAVVDEPEHENGNDELKTHLRGAAAVLRSRLPELVYQETWAHLIVHHATCVLIARASAAADPHPDQISYLDTLRLIRRTATGTADIPP